MAKKVGFPYPRFLHIKNLESLPDEGLRKTLEKILYALRDRYKNSEYVEFCPYYKLTFQSSDNQFVIQTDCYTYSFKIYNKKKHKKFLTQLYNFKVKSHEKTLE